MLRGTAERTRSSHFANFPMTVLFFAGANLANQACQLDPQAVQSAAGEWRFSGTELYAI